MKNNKSFPTTMPGQPRTLPDEPLFKLFIEGLREIARGAEKACMAVSQLRLHYSARELAETANRSNGPVRVTEELVEKMAEFSRKNIDLRLLIDDSPAATILQKFPAAKVKQYIDTDLGVVTATSEAPGHEIRMKRHTDLSAAEVAQLFDANGNLRSAEQQLEYLKSKPLPFSSGAEQKPAYKVMKDGINVVKRVFFTWQEIRDLLDKHGKEPEQALS